MDTTWKSFKEWTRFSKTKPRKDLQRSDYSLVACGEYNADTLQLWLGLPEEVKNDPSLDSFRKQYELNVDTPKPKKQNSKRLTNVQSAPTITQRNEDQNGRCDVIEEESPRGTQRDQEIKVVKNAKNEKISLAKYYVKMSILLACWVSFTIIFMLYGEREEEEVITSVAFGEEKYISLPHMDEMPAIALTLSGPFLSEHEQIKMNSTDYDIASKLVVWLEGVGNENNRTSTPWIIPINTTPTKEVLTKVLTIPNSNLSRTALHMNTTATRTVAFVISYSVSPIDVATGVVYGLGLLCGLYVLIVFEVINRTMAAVTVCTASLAALALLGQRPSLNEIVSWLDSETLLLLFSMMILVAITAETGIFDYLAVFAFQVTKGQLWPLIYLLCATTAVFSTFLDNVTTVLLMSPVTIRLCEVMDLDPVPILMLMAIYSNIGGCATPVGDPPNVIVVSNKDVALAGINFSTFTLHMGLGVLLIALQTSIQVRFLFRDTDSLRTAVPKDIQEITRQISIWRRAVDSLPHLSNDVAVVRERLERKIDRLTERLGTLVKESHKRACPEDTFQSTLQDLKGKYKIRDKPLLIKSSAAICFVVVVFFLHSIPELNRVSLGWTALLGAILLLTLADREDLEPVLHRVEWSTLLFFGALFVMMEALSKLGLIKYIGGLMEMLILRVDEDTRLAVAIMLILWVSGMISAFVDNIPLSTMMVRVVVAIGSNPALDLPMSPLVWALLYGACLGGNGTLIGASANVVCAGVAEQHGYKFTFTRFFKVGFPLMIGHLVMASVYLLICHCVIGWH